MSFNLQNISDLYVNKTESISFHDNDSSGHKTPECFIPVFTRRIPGWKRIVDILGSSIGIVLLSPVFLVFSIFIKIVSPGPVFFKQIRVGSGGKLFPMIKFRTMNNKAACTSHKNYLKTLINDSDNTNCSGNIPMIKPQYDSRVLPFAHLLRNSGLDELPQLFNVFRGEMSLVGPRPSIPYEVEEFKPWYLGRFDILPGMTGLWQVSGKNRLTFNEMIRLDIQYAQNQSPWLDIKIILLTPYAVIKQIKDISKNKYKLR